MVVSRPSISFFFSLYCHGESALVMLAISHLEGSTGLLACCGELPGPLLQPPQIASIRIMSTTGRIVLFLSGRWTAFFRSLLGAMPKDRAFF